MTDIPEEPKEPEDPEKAAKKAAKKAEKERLAAEKAAKKAAEAERKKGKTLEVPRFTLSSDFPGPNTQPYGDLWIQSNAKTGRTWLNLGSLSEADVGQERWLRCRLHSTR